MRSFIIGLFFGYSILVILDGFTSLILTFIEMIKSYINIKIVLNNQKINDLSEPEGGLPIGFSAGEEENSGL